MLYKTILISFYKILVNYSNNSFKIVAKEITETLTDILTENTDEEGLYKENLTDIDIYFLELINEALIVIIECDNQIEDESSIPLTPIPIK